MHVDGAATRSYITRVDSIGETAITTSVSLAARTGDGPEPMGPYPILTAIINRLSVSGPLRHFGAAQSVGPFCAKADIERLTEPAASVEIDSNALPLGPFRAREASKASGTSRPIDMRVSVNGTIVRLGREWRKRAPSRARGEDDAQVRDRA